ncbi:protein SOB FIVE-LIKE 3 [Argentina anserina]|uniref:protein SOB FIVE-LIKE 3 n=1 Tax=Argentina anserina TaxID=57926 RepID=UPI0021768CFE|nr:protein SOB FIVE-LIKE 3 [Potentilla anserina]
MDPSKSYESHHAEEECQSSESGWTMYLGSRLDGENDHHQHHQDHSDDDYQDGRKHGYDHKDDSDDSMVSDASSGPSTHQRSRSVYVGKQEEKAKTKKKSTSGAARMSREYSKAAEKKAKIINSKAK